MNEEELRFIVRMTDQASATLKQIKDAAEKAGGGAKDLKDSADKADMSLGKLVKTAKEAAVAVTSFWASSKIAKSSTHAYGELEEEMRRVAQTTKLSESGMVSYRAALVDLSQEMQNVPTEKLTHFSEVAGLLGGRSVSEITEFTKTMAKLDRIDDIGEAGPTQIGRLLTNLHEGLDTVPRFAAVFHTLKNDTKASAQEILNMASVLTQATSRMNMTSTAVTAMAAGLAQMDMDPGLAANSIGKAFSQIYDAALQGSQGMDELTKSLGMNRMEFLQLLEAHPEQAMYNFLNVLRKLQQEGKSPTPLLTLFNLQDLEAQRTLGTAAKNLPKLLQKDRLGREAKEKADKGGKSDLDIEFDKARKQVNDSSVAIENAFKQLKQSIGSGLAPVIVPVMQAIAGAANLVTSAFQALPHSLQVAASTALVLGTGFGSLRLAVNLLRSAGTALATTLGVVRTAETAAGVAAAASSAGFFTLTGAANAAKLALRGILPLAIGLLVAEGVKSSEDWFANWFERNFGQGVTDKLRAFRKEYESFFDFMAQDPFTGTIQSGPNAGKNWWTGKTDFVKNDKGQWKEASKDADQAHASHGDETAPYLKDTRTDALSRLTAQQKQTIGGLLPLFQQAQELQTQLVTIQALEENLRRDAEKAGGSLTAEEERLIGSAKAMLALKKAQLDPTYEAVRAAQDQQAQAEAVTKELQNQLAVTQALRTAREKAGTLSADDEQKIRSALEKAQAAERQKAFSDQMRGLEDELNAAVAVTKADKDRLEVQKLIADAIREQGYTEDQLAQIKSIKTKTQQAQIQAAYADEIRGIREATALTMALTQQERDRLEIAYKLADLKREKGYNDRQLGDIKGALEAQKQAEAFASLRQELDPVGQATRDYTFKVSVLQKAMADGVITGEQFGQMLRSLQLKTLDQRDPFAAQVLSLQQQIALEKVQGQYRDADKQTMQTVLQLQRQGVELNDTQIKQLAALNRQLEDTKKEQSSGLTGWMNGVGTLKDNLMDLTKDFGSGLSGAISGALQGKKGAFSQFFGQLGGKMIDLSVNQLLKTGLQESGLGAGLDGVMKQLGGTEKAAPFDMGALKSLQTQMMTVAAGTVVVNGGVAGLPGSIPGLTPQTGGVPSIAANDNITTGTAATGLPPIVPTVDGNVVALAAAAAARQAVASQAAGSAAGAGIDAAKGGWSLDGSSFRASAHGNAVDARLLDILKTTSERTGVKAEAFSGVREWGQGGQGHPSGLATDMRIFDPRTGKELANYQDPTTFRQYEQYAQAARQVQMEKYPELADQFRWGGYFSGPKGKYGAMDSMHFDLMGRKGGLGMAGGSWEGGLTAAQRAYFPGAQSFGIGQGPLAPSQIPTQVGGIDRSAFTQQLADPEMRAKLFAMTHAEVGTQGPQAQQAFMETIFNRASSRGQTLGRTLSGFYFPQQTYDEARRVMDDPKLRAAMEAKYADTLKQVQGGSNLSRYATGNASGTVGFAGGPQTFAAGGERFGIEGYDAEWVRQQKLLAAADRTTTGSVPKVDENQLEAAREAARARAMSPVAANDNQQLELQRQQEEQLRQAQLAQQQYSQSLTQTSQTMAQATPQLGGLGQGITGLLAPLANAIPGLGKFGKGIMSLAMQLLSQLGSGGGGGGGLLGSLLGGLFHGGGEPGVTAPPAGVKAVSMSAWASAPRFHTGLKNDEYPAILQRNERVLTRAQNTTTKAQMSAMADTIDRMGSVIANSNARAGTSKHMTVVNNITTPNADSFRRSDGQRAADTAVLMQRMSARNN